VTTRQLVALGTLYTALFVAWFLGALAVRSPSAALFAEAGTVLVLGHSLFAWTSLHWLTPQGHGSGFVPGAFALVSTPLPVYALIVSSGGLSWTAVGRTGLALAVLLVAGHGLLTVIRRALPAGAVSAATATSQLAPAAVLWAFRDDWLVRVLS
jgi:hypothetical protein